MAPDPNHHKENIAMALTNLPSAFGSKAKPKNKSVPEKNSRQNNESNQQGNHVNPM
jgi:hypothetical protein